MVSPIERKRNKLKSERQKVPETPKYCNCLDIYGTNALIFWALCDCINIAYGHNLSHSKLLDIHDSLKNLLEQTKMVSNCNIISLMCDQRGLQPYIIVLYLLYPSLIHFETF